MKSFGHIFLLFPMKNIAGRSCSCPLHSGLTDSPLNNGNVQLIPFLFLAAGHSKLGTLVISRRITCKNSHILFLLIHQGAIFVTLQFDSSVSMIRAFPKNLFQLSERLHTSPPAPSFPFSGDIFAYCSLNLGKVPDDISYLSCCFCTQYYHNSSRSIFHALTALLFSVRKLEHNTRINLFWDHLSLQIHNLAAQILNYV